jgi:hypothetical protein
VRLIFWLPDNCSFDFCHSVPLMSDYTPVFGKWTDV